MLELDLLLTHFDPGLDIVVDADACNYGVRAITSHRFPILELVVEAISTGRWPKFKAGSTLCAFHNRSADLSTKVRSSWEHVL